MSDPSYSSQARVGFLYAVGGFLLWGLSPIFWKWLASVPAEQQLAHRVLWCAAVITAILLARGRLRECLGVISETRTLVTLLGTTLLIGGNWFCYIWAVATDRILHASLGYFINPLVYVLLGVVFLGESLRPRQKISVFVATIGVALMTWRLGTLPWLSLALAGTFGLYGLLRKQVKAGPEQGLFLETWMLVPPAAWYLLWLEPGTAAWGSSGWELNLLLMGTGVITATPLIWFTHGARRLELSTVGILQYIAPTGQFLLAVLVYDEPFDQVRALAFVFIWVALALFTHDLYRNLPEPTGAADPRNDT